MDIERIHAQRQVNKWRAIYRLVEINADLWVTLDHSELQEVREFVQQGNLEGLKMWLDEYRKNSLEGQSIVEIRKIASMLGIRYYNTLSKARLIYKIRRLKSVADDS